MARMTDRMQSAGSGSLVRMDAMIVPFGNNGWMGADEGGHR